MSGGDENLMHLSLRRPAREQGRYPEKELRFQRVGRRCMSESGIHSCAVDVQLCRMSRPCLRAGLCKCYKLCFSTHPPQVEAIVTAL